MIEINRVLAPTDFSAHSEQARPLCLRAGGTVRGRAAPCACPLGDHSRGARSSAHAGDAARSSTRRTRTGPRRP